MAERPAKGLARGRVPDLGHPPVALFGPLSALLTARRHDLLAVRAEGHGIDPAGLGVRQRQDFLLGAEVPDQSGAVPASGQDLLTVRAEGGRLDAAPMLEDGAGPQRGGLPEPGPASFSQAGHGEEPLTVRAEGGAMDRAVARTAQDPKPAGGQVPEPGGPVLAPGQGAFAVGAESRGPDLVVVGEQYPQVVQ